MLPPAIGTLVAVALLATAVSAGTCGSPTFTCPSGYSAYPSETTCASAVCLLSECCTEASAGLTCGGGSYVCPQGDAPKNVTTLCGLTSCNLTDCCTAQLTCGSVGYVCPMGYAEKSASTFCASEGCNLTDCCTDPCSNYTTCTTCAVAGSCGWCGSSMTCNTGTWSGTSWGTCWSNWAWESTSCPAPAMPTCGFDYVCPVGFTRKDATTRCASAACNVTDCCTA
eukprot:RCo026432